MPPSQLKETTMDPAKRTLLRVVVPRRDKREELAAFRGTEKLVESLMGRRPELRLAFIQERARFIADIDV
jgi:topoisomerase-4 subunit B